MEELMSEFNVIDGLHRNSSGTRIIIWNLRRTHSGELEFDFTRDDYDIQIPFDVYKRTRNTKKQQLEAEKWMPESKYPLWAYCSILYLKPRMQIIIRRQKVETQFITKSLAHVFKDSYKPLGLGKTIKITFGYNTKSKEHYGLMMYHKNRLIKAYERVPCQRKANSSGVGVIGVIECNYLKPTHNKQNTEEYRKTMLSVGIKLEHHWKEVGHRHKKILHCTEPIEDLLKRPDQIWVQCDECLKWCKLPDGIVADKLPKHRFCRMNSDPKFRSCTVEEEPEDPDDEQHTFKKTYKKDEKQQKLQKEERLQTQKGHSSDIQITASPPDATTNKPSFITTPTSFVCAHAGQFHCKLTNLIFEMKGKGEVFCTTESWDRRPLQGIRKYQPAGPLYNITCSEGSILYLYLPHCEIHADRNHTELTVAHFSEGNMEILQPLKVTNTHVIIEVQHMSLFGLLKKWITPETSINAQVLLFHQTLQQRKKLYIYLLPGNVPVKEVQNQHEGNTYIQCSSICQLTPGKKYKPSCLPYVSQPKVATFLHDYGPNYHPTFEVILDTDIQDLTLILLDEIGQEVWEPHQVLLTAGRRANVSNELGDEAEFVDNHRDILIQRVLLVMEIADTLLTKEMISNEMYNDIKETSTSQDKMRVLYRSLDSGGRAMKDGFYKVLKEKQPFIVNDLESMYKRSSNKTFTYSQM